jgi:hypothetical protein
MKLYTEEQINWAMRLATLTDDTYNQVLEQLTPIELPSDEEIRIKYKDFISHYISHYGKESFFDGAIWLKEQIINQNK